MPLFLMVGFGPLAAGTGQFDGIRGMLSVNSGVSVLPTTLYNIYVLRIADPDHKLRARGATLDLPIAIDLLSKYGFRRAICATEEHPARGI